MSGQKLSKNMMGYVRSQNIYTRRVVEAKREVPANSTLLIGATYRPGVYVVEAIQGGKRVILKLAKQPD